MSVEFLRLPPFFIDVFLMIFKDMTFVFTLFSQSLFHDELRKWFFFEFNYFKRRWCNEGKYKMIIMKNRTEAKINKANFSTSFWSYNYLIMNPQVLKTIRQSMCPKEKWIPDKDVTNCFKCDSRFNKLFRWKHHCRICGRIFCSPCC